MATFHSKLLPPVYGVECGVNIWISDDGSELDQILANVVMVFGGYEGIRCISKRITKLLGSEVSDYGNTDYGKLEFRYRS